MTARERAARAGAARAAVPDETATPAQAKTAADMTGGIEWLIDAFDCDPARLSSTAPLATLSRAVIAQLGLRVVGEPLLHRFGEPAGVTGLYLLSESHLAWHTYPESALATLNLYCCRTRPELDWSGLLGAALGARRVQVEAVRRGLGSTPGSGT